jgi:hypothetical protein
MNAAQPGLEIGEHEMDDGQKGFRDFHVAPLRDGGMKVSAFPECRITAPIVGNNGGTRCHGAFDEADQRLCAPVLHHGEADSPGVTPVLPLVEAAGALALQDFDGTGHEHHVVNATPFATRATADPSFVGFDNDFWLAADPVLVGTHHAGAQLVEYLKSSFVARQPELTLELDGRHARRLAGNEVRSPEPDRKRRVGAFHDGTCCEAGFPSAMPTAKNTGASAISVRFAGRITVGAHETVTPSRPLKVGRARGLIREQSLKLRQRARERQIISLKYVDNHDSSTLTQILNILLVVGVCDNRISTERMFRWAGLGETFSEITDSAGNKQIVSKDQTPIAIKVVTQSLLEKFVRFQEPRFHAADGPMTRMLVSHFNFLKQQSPDEFVPQVLGSKEYYSVVEQRTKWFWWKPGRYELTLKPSSPQKFKLIGTTFSFELQEIDVDLLRKNLPLVDTEIRNLIMSNISDAKPEQFTWQWANVNMLRNQGA